MLPILGCKIISKLTYRCGFSDVALEWAGETEEGGVDGWKFVGSPMTFDNGSIYPETECYCSGDCVPYGARNVSACKFGAPAFVSFPHFYLAHESYKASITGMCPNETHQFVLKMEPVSVEILYLI